MCDTEVYEGGGLFGSKVELPPCDTAAMEQHTGEDTDEIWSGGGGFGKSVGCSTTPSISGWWLVLALVWALGSAAFGQDLQTVQPLDGDMVAVRSAIHAPAWAPWAAVTYHLGVSPVTAVDERGRRNVVDSLSTTLVGAGFSFGIIQLGVVVPHHSLRWAEGRDGAPATVDRGVGDVLFLLSTHSRMR